MQTRVCWDIGRVWALSLCRAVAVQPCDTDITSCMMKETDIIVELVLVSCKSDERHSRLLCTRDPTGKSSV